MTTVVFPEGHRYDVGIIWSDANPTPVLSGLRDRLANAPSLMSEILVAVTGPPTIDRAAREMAYLLLPRFTSVFTAFGRMPTTTRQTNDGTTKR